MIKVLKDDDLKREMSKKGIEQAKGFAWDKSAEEILNIFKECLNQK